MCIMNWPVPDNAKWSGPIEEPSGKEPKKRACQWPRDFVLDEYKTRYAIQKGVHPRKVRELFEEFHDWAIDKGAVSKDWNARFRNWVRKAPEWNKRYMGTERKILPKESNRIHLLAQAKQHYECSKDQFDHYCNAHNFTDEERESVIVAATHDIKELANGALKEV